MPCNWRAGALWLIVASVSCGGGKAPAAPTPPVAPPAPAPPTVPANTWSLAGSVLDTAGQQPLSGIEIAPSWDLGAVLTAADGTYALGAAQNPPTTPYKLSVSGAGVVTRELWVTWQRGARSNVTLDAIRNAPPFSMEFYRQFVRGTYDQPDAPWAVLRWTVPPRFYIKTVDQAGRPIEPEVLAVIRDALFRATPAFTGGRLATAAVESGPEGRAEADGWLNIDILRDPNERRRCGFAYVGANPGTITLFNDLCSCGSVKIPGAVVMHEVGHALGFFHVPDARSVMYPFAPGNCPPGDLSPSEKYHSAIAYSRPRGNVDPDNDPSSSRFLTPSNNPRILSDR